jgi:hypothetical protein
MSKKNKSGSSKTGARFKAKKKTAPMLQAMVWYKEAHYRQLLALFDDTHLLPGTYREWLDRAETKKKEIEEGGDRVIKVFIDPETFPEWCRKRGCKLDAEARSQLAIEVAQANSFSL